MKKEAIELAETYAFSFTVVQTTEAIKKVEGFMGKPIRLNKDVVMSIVEANRWLNFVYLDEEKAKEKMYYLTETDEGFVVRQGIRKDDPPKPALPEIDEDWDNPFSPYGRVR